MLDRGLPYVSGPEWLKANLLRERWVLAVAGTHGKTTTASMLAWVLDGRRARPRLSDRRRARRTSASRPAWARPPSSWWRRTSTTPPSSTSAPSSSTTARAPLILNNLEFDHADIFDDLAQIQRQFHHLVRTVPGSGLIIHPQGEAALDQVLAMGCWTPREAFGGAAATGAAGAWLERRTAPGSGCCSPGPRQGEVHWGQTGRHNVANALAVLAAARHAGVPAGRRASRPWGASRGSSAAWNCAARPGACGSIDDFAHHPTAIATTLEGLRRQAGRGGASSPSWSRAPTPCAWGSTTPTGRLAGGRGPGLCLCPARSGLGRRRRSLRRLGARAAVSLGSRPSSRGSPPRPARGSGAGHEQWRLPGHP